MKKLMVLMLFLTGCGFSLTGATGLKGDRGNIGPSGSDWQQSVATVSGYEYSALLIICSLNGTDVLSGSGILVGQNKVLTAGHVLFEAQIDACKLYSKFYGSNPVAVVHNSDFQQAFNKRDIGLITLESPINYLNIATVKLDSQFQIGQSLLTLSHPLGWFDPELTMGYVADLESDIDESELTATGLNWSDSINVGITATQGSSGAPIFDVSGAVVGILVGGVSTTAGDGPLQIATILPLEQSDNLNYGN